MAEIFRAKVSLANGGLRKQIPSRGNVDLIGCRWSLSRRMTNANVGPPEALAIVALEVSPFAAWMSRHQDRICVPPAPLALEGTWVLHGSPWNDTQRANLAP